MIAFCRHGQTAPNRDGLLLGRADPPLTGAGARQAEQLSARLASEPIVAVLTSPLQRARDTAAAIASATGCAVEVDERLVEIHYGEWDGLSFAELPPDLVAMWRRDPAFAPPGGESLLDVEARMGATTGELLGRAGNGVVVAVSHVSPIKAAVSWALGTGPELAWRMRLDVASITRIAPGPTLLSFNERA
ncbi:MAG: histidine phosphatase family protein [Acidimicrobiia bacterium]